jgi:hypothetical protein
MKECEMAHGSDLIGGAVIAQLIVQPEILSRKERVP